MHLIKSLLHSVKTAIKSDPEVHRFARKYPRLSRFLKNRFTPDERFGLHLTLGIIITIFFSVLFFGVLQDYVNKEALVEADLRILNLVEIFRSAKAVNFMIAITSFGNWEVVFLGAALLSVMFLLAKNWRYLSALIFSILGGEAIVWIIKHLVQRPRPPIAGAIIPEISYSFPSGHTFVAISFYGLLAYFLFHSVKRRSLKVLIIFLACLLIALIGLSRIYLGSHWPSDVFASLASGFAWLAVIITALDTRRKFNHRKQRKPFLGASMMRFYASLAIVLWLAFYAGFSHKHFLAILPSVVSAEKIQMLCAELPEKAFSVLPRMSETVTGSPMEPINVILVGEKEKIKTDFLKAGWVEMDKANLSSSWRLVKASFFKESYPGAPGAPSFWNAEPNEWAFEQPTLQNSVSERHHIHLWETPVVCGGKPVWFGTAHFDAEIKKNGIFPTHVIDPAVDRERDKIKSDFEKINAEIRFYEFKIVEPMMGSNFSGDYFFTDGKAYVFEF